MMKKISALVLALAVSASLALGCFAAPTSTGTVSYDGSALTVTGDMSGFSGMTPGVPKSGTITLTNNGKNTANFYMDTNVISTLIQTVESKESAGYTVSLTCGGTTLYGYDPATGATGTLIGGTGTNGLSELNGKLNEYLLVATLDSGKSTDVNFSITPDARSMGNSYQASQGLVQFTFQAADVVIPVVTKTVEKDGEDTVVNVTRTLLVSAKTGDTNVIFIAGGILAAALIVVFVARKKKKEERKDA